MKKTFTIAAIATLWLMGCSTEQQARPVQVRAAVTELLSRIRSDLPSGWSASYDQGDSWLMITRDEPVLCRSMLPCGPSFQEPELRKFAFGFVVVDLVTPSEWQRMKAENMKTMTELYHDLVRRDVLRIGKRERFSPRTEEEEKAVARYKATRLSLRRLPDFYYKDISIKWAFNGSDHPLFSACDSSIAGECANVRANVVKMLSDYECAQQ